MPSLKRICHLALTGAIIVFIGFLVWSIEVAAPWNQAWHYINRAENV